MTPATYDTRKAEAEAEAERLTTIVAKRMIARHDLEIQLRQLEAKIERHDATTEEFENLHSDAIHALEMLEADWEEAQAAPVSSAAHISHIGRQEA